MKILTFTKLYPNAQMPEHGIFVARRMQALNRIGTHEIKVVAPIPYFPSFLPARGEWKKLQLVPREEKIQSMQVYHPRYFNPPKIGMSKYGDWMAQGSESLTAKLFHNGFPFDVIDAHFVYPDGFAAIRLGKKFNCPVIVTARGSDVSRNKNIPYIVPRLRAVVRQATKLIAVSEELRDELIALGAAAENVHVIPNGIDTETFFPLSAEEARRQLSLSADDSWLISVARIDENKGQRIIIEALKKIGLDELQKRRIKVALIGQGESRREFEQLSQTYGLNDIVHFVGHLNPEKICFWYNAAKIKILASSREGSPNVVLESLACGTPVIATYAGRNAAIIRESENGFLFPAGDSEALARLILKALDFSWNRERIFKSARQRSWETVAGEIEEVFRLAINKNKPL